MRKLNNWLHSYMEFTKKSEAPAVYHLWSGLWALSAALQRKCWMEFDHFDLYPNLFVVLTGPPASHKGTAAGIANKIIKKVEGISTGPDVVTEAQLYPCFTRSKDTFDHEDKEKTTHCSISIYSSEWSTLMRIKDLDMCNTMCKLYDCDDTFRKETKTQGFDFMENVFMTMMACSTAKQINDCLPYSSIGSGFTSRVIFVVGDADKDRRNPRPKKTQKQAKLQADLIYDLQHIRDTMIGKFEFSEGGGKYFDRWYMNRNEPLEQFEKFQHYIDRKPVHVETVAMLLSASRDDKLTIGAGEIADAINMLESIEPRMPEALGGVGLSLNSPIVQAVMKKLREQKRMSFRQLQTFLWEDASPIDLQLALTTLIGSDLPVDRDASGNYIWTGKGGRR